MKEKTYEEVLDEMISDKINNPNHYQGAFGLEAINVVRNFAGNLTAVQGFYWGECNQVYASVSKEEWTQGLEKGT